MFLRNKITNEICEFGALQGLDWALLTENEVKAHNLQKAQDEKIAQIKSVAASLILATYPSYKQSNILMSQDDDLIQQMNLFILPIRVKSNKLEADLNLLTDLEEIKNFKIEF